MNLVFLSFCVIAVLTQRVSTMSFSAALQNFSPAKLAQQVNSFSLPKSLSLPASLTPSAQLPVPSSLPPPPPSPATPSPLKPVQQSVIDEDELNSAGRDQLQGNQGQNLLGQGLQRQLSPKQVVQSQNPGEGIASQSLQGPTMLGQGIQRQSVPSQNLPAQNVQGQSFQTQNPLGQSVQSQSVQNQNSPVQGAQSESSQGQAAQTEDSEESEGFLGQDFNMAFLDSADSRLVAQKGVSTIFNVFREKKLREAILDLLRKGEMFEDPNVYAFIESLQNNFNRLILEPSNLETVSQLLDIGTAILLDEKYSKLFQREMSLVDEFLEDRVAKLIFEKIGNVFTIFTMKAKIYEAAGNVMDQVNVLMDKEKMLKIHDFALRASSLLVGY